MSETHFYVSKPFAVQTYDIDFGGVVSNIVYIRWLEDLRLLILDTYYPLEAMMAKGLAPVVAETRIRYRRPVRLFDKPVGEAWLAGVTPGRLHFRLKVTVAGSVVTEAEQICCIVELNTGKPVRIPPEFRIEL